MTEDRERLERLEARVQVQRYLLLHLCAAAADGPGYLQLTIQELCYPASPNPDMPDNLREEMALFAEELRIMVETSSS